MKVLGLKFFLGLLISALYISTSHIEGETKLASVASDGTQGNNHSEFDQLAISGDGRIVAFESEASNLVEFDFNNADDLFIYDRVTGTTEMMPQGNATFDQWMVLSHDGRFVAFRSHSTDLVPKDTNDAADIFVFDRQTGELDRISLSSDGVQANDDSFVTAISPDGRYVSYYTYADNLLPGVDTNWHTLIRDTEQNLTIPGSVDHEGQPIKSAGGKMTPDARFVGFDSYQPTVVPGDDNGYLDVFLHDRVQGTTERVSVSSTGEEGNEDSFFVDLTTDGRYMIFGSWATNLVSTLTNGSQLYRHDRITGKTELVSVAFNGEGGNGDVWQGGISATGRFITFSTIADNIVQDDTNGWTDVFVRDMVFGQTRLISVSINGDVGNASSATPVLSQGGRIFAFVSSASDLVIKDNNGFRDIFTRELWYPTLASNYDNGAPGSVFALSGTRSLVTSTITATVNGVSLGSVPVNPDGSFAFQLATNQADPGRYTVGVFAPFADEVAVIDLDPAFPARPPEGSGPIFEIPAGIAERILYLPAVFR